MSNNEPSLSDLRRLMDQLDDQLHELLMKRFTLVSQVAEAKARETAVSGNRVCVGNAGGAVRPGREAQVLRRLVAQHSGPLPPEVIVKIWRELVSAATHMQGSYGVFVYGSVQQQRYWDLARFYFGALTPLTLCESIDEVVQAIVREPDCIGLLPTFDAPKPDDGAWPPKLAALGKHGPRIVARLPFVGGSSTSPDFPSAFVVAVFDPEASGDDTSLLLIEVTSQASKADLDSWLSASGFDGAEVMLGPNKNSDGVSTFTVAVNGFVTTDDRRIVDNRQAGQAPIGDVIVLGTFANPIDLGRAPNSDVDL